MENSSQSVGFTQTAYPAVGDALYANREFTTVIGSITEITTTEGYVTAVKVSDIVYNRAAVQYKLTTPFGADKIRDISYTQSLDVVYLAFSDGRTEPYTLSRRANNDWTLAKFVTEDGPYLDTNFNKTRKMKIEDTSTSSSTVTLTGFKLGAEDVGRWIRINTPRYNENTYVYEDRWSYGKIATVASGGASITVTWQYRASTASDTDWMKEATTSWRLGVWHTGTGNSDYPVTYPTKVTIHQQRLVWAGMTDRPWVWTSNSFAYKNYAPSDYEGVISDSNSIIADISTDKVSEIFWMKSVKGLLLGTELGEIRLYSSGTGITPSDFVTKRDSSFGSFNAEPIVTDDNIIFIQRLQRTIRSMSYEYQNDSYVGPELTILAENLTTGGIRKIIYQKEPNNTIWAIKEDGELLTLTYDKTQEVMGWAKSKLAGTNSKVIDAVSLPSNVYQQDMVLFVVERDINGSRVRYLEMLSPNFIENTTQADSCFVDSAVRVSSEEPFDIIAGLDYLEGETVRVMEDGGLIDDVVVEDGEIQLHKHVSDVTIGLPYEAYFETLERDFGDSQISTKVSKLRVYKMKMYLSRTAGITVQRLETGSVSPLISFDPNTLMSNTPELVTGKVDIAVGGAWDCEYRLRVISEPGMPCTVAGIILGVEINAV